MGVTTSGSVRPQLDELFVAKGVPSERYNPK